MKLYEVDQKIENLLSQLEPDPETGEVQSNEDEIHARLEALTLTRKDILQGLARLALNARSDVAALKEEEQRLKERRQRAEARKDRLMAVLDRECGGKKTDLGIATLIYSRTSRVEFTDESKVLRWLKENGHEDCYRVPKPEIHKTLVGRLLDDGIAVPGAEKVTGSMCYLR